MHKHERRIAEDLSQRIDNVLAGKDAPVDDALLSLAAEIAGAPVLSPSHAFARQLRQKLLSSRVDWPVRSKWRWPIRAGALVTVVIALLVLVWNPWSPPSAQEVLARAVDAISVESGQIEHLVMRTTHQTPGTGSGEGLFQLWIRIGEMPDGSLAGVEQINLSYDPGDADLENPTFASYWDLAGKWCSLHYVGQQPIPDIPDVDENGCTSLDFDMGPSPALGNMSSPRDWLDSLEKSDKWEVDQEAYPDHLNGRPVYRLEYSGECETIEIRDGLDEKTTYACRMMLYIDRETYMLVGGESEPVDGSGISSSYTLLSYEVLDPGKLGFDPLVWPPQQ